MLIILYVMKELFSLIKREFVSHYTAEHGLPLLYTLTALLTVFFCRMQAFNTLDTALFLLFVSVLVLPVSISSKPFFTNVWERRKTAEARYHSGARLILARFITSALITLKTLFLAVITYVLTGMLYGAAKTPLGEGLIPAAFAAVILGFYSIIIGSVNLFKLNAFTRYFLPLLFAASFLFFVNLFNLEPAALAAAYRYKLYPLAAAALILTAALFLIFWLTQKPKKVRR